MIPKEPLLRKLGPYVMPAIVVLVGLSAFGLGRLSALGEEGRRLVIQQTAQSAAATQALVAGANVAPAPLQEGEGRYVASKSGTRYYLPSCSGVSRIKEENKVWFKTAEEARAAGYTPAANCPGL